MNCLGRKELGVDEASSSTFSIAPLIPLLPGVCTSSAPQAARTVLLYILMVSGIARIKRYPFTATVIANPIPVFPPIGSIIVVPRPICLFLSASSIMFKQILSLTRLPGFLLSCLATIFALETAGEIAHTYQRGSSDGPQN